jgi:hypothetical protein
MGLNLPLCSTSLSSLEVGGNSTRVLMAEMYTQFGVLNLSDVHAIPDRFDQDLLESLIVYYHSWPLFVLFARSAFG